ncbi:MAG: hypothetical protein ACT4PP_16745 [Sporichthyaceae bacterium]
MGRMPEEVIGRELDTAWQNVFTYASWSIVLVMVVVAMQLGRRHRTPFFLLAILAAGVGAFAEPLYDVAFDLWFYDANADGTPGAMQSHFSAFGIVQPNWTHSGYIILYAMIALYAGKKMYDGTLSHKALYLIWGAEILTSCVFEVIGTATDVYTYYGPYELRIVNYPFVIGVLEGTQTLLFTVLAVQIWRRVRTAWGLSALLVAFPITMFGVNFGIGSPIIIALHLDEGDFNTAFVWAATFLTIGLCAIAVRGATLFLPKPFAQADAEPDGVRLPVNA